MDNELDIPQFFIMFIMALTRDVIDFTYKEMKIGRLIFVINYIGFKGECTMKEIRDYLNVKPSTATRQIDKLVEDLLLVQRVTSDSDRRNVLIKLTDEGRKVYNHHKDVQEKMIQKLLTKFSAEEIRVITKVVVEFLKDDSIIPL